MASNAADDGETPVDGTEDDQHRDQSSGLLFSGQKLWFSHALPSRSWLIQNAKAYGATVVAMDKDADIRLVDHTKKGNASGTYSFQYVEKSIRNGKLENLQDYAIGMTTKASKQGSSLAAGIRSSKIPFTNDDDQLLWDWVKPFEEKGGAWKGNDIYKQIESINPRHTFQSWRDRYIKHTRFQNRQVSAPVPEIPRLDISPTRSSTRFVDPPQQQRAQRPGNGRSNADGPANSVEALQQQNADSAESDSKICKRKSQDEIARRGPSSPVKKRRITASGTSMDTSTEASETPQPSPPLRIEPPQPFSREETERLYDLVPKLSHLSLDQFREIWTTIATSEDWPGRTPDQWKNHFERVVIPDYCKEHGTAIEMIAPYLIGGKDDGNPNQTSTSAKQPTSPIKQQTPPDSLETQACSNCFTEESRRWLNDKQGNLLCHECAVFLRLHGVSRPSTIGLTVGSSGTQARLSEGLSEPSAASQATSNPLNAPQITTTPKSSYVNRGTSPIIPSAAHGNAGGGVDDRRSPSFQPESPTLARPPKTNKGRKRLAGRGSQSQSTSQESNNTDSQSGITSRRKEDLALLNDFLPLPPIDARPDPTDGPRAQVSWRASGHGKKDRYKPRDGLGDLEDDVESTFRTEEPSEAQPAVVRSKLPVEERKGLVLSPKNKLPSRAARKTIPRPSLVRYRVPEKKAAGDSESEDDLELQDLPGVTHQVQTSEIADQMTSPLSVKLVSDADHIPIQRGSTLSTSSADSNLHRSKHRERFDTAPETMDEFETATEGQTQSKRNATKDKPRRLSTQALFDQVDTQDPSFLLDLELPEPEGGWESILGEDSAIRGQPTQHGSDGSSKSSEEVPKGEVKSASKGKGKAPLRAAPVTNTSDERSDQLSPELYTVLPLPAGISPSSVDDNNSDPSSQPQLSTWLAYQKSIHSDIPPLSLSPILFKAIEATSFDFSLASIVVTRMLSTIPSRERASLPVDTEIQLPSDMKEVWTAVDDVRLMSVDTRDVALVLDKHGKDSCNARFDFLRELVEEGE